MFMFTVAALDVAIAQIVATTPEIEEMEQSGTSTASANNNTKQRYGGSLRNGNDKETHGFDLSRSKDVVVGSFSLIIIFLISKKMFL